MVKKYQNDILRLVVFCLALVLLVAPVMAATTQVQIVKYANDGTSVLASRTVNYSWMSTNLPVLGDGTTHYYHQGPVFVDDPNETREQELRWNPAEDTNVLEKDMGAVKGTNLKDLCDLVGGMSAGERVKVLSSDGWNKWFAYKNVYEYSSREGPIGICWYKDGKYPDSGWSEGMRMIWFADDAVNKLGPGGTGVHAFGNFDWHEAAAPEYWYYYQSGGENYPTTTGISGQYVNRIYIYSDDAPLVAPVAAFSGTPLSGDAPLTVQFTDASTGTITGYAWDFDNDGTTDSTAPSPSHLYDTAGTYTVNLTVTNAAGSDSEVKADYISVTAAAVTPIAAFVADPLSGTAPLTVQFTDKSTGDGITGWAWDFTNDGTVDSTEQKPSHLYNTAGTYTVNLTVTNAAGSDSEVKADYITVTSAPVAPVAVFSADPQSGNAPLTVHFTDASTGTAPLSYEWDFNNDGTTDSTVQSPSFIYTATGTYTVNLTVTNEVGSDSEMKTDHIVVSEAPPLPVLNVNTGIRYATIQGAVTAASTGHTIIVSDGSYTENVVIDKSITIRSEHGAATTTVTATNSAVPVFDVNAADFVTIDGFTVRGATGSNVGGIDFTDSDSGMITHNDVGSGFNGIHLGGSSTNNTVSDNNCHDNSKRGLSIRNTAYGNFAFRNTFSANADKDICIKDTTHDNVIWLNNLLGGTLDIGTANTENSPAPVTYTYNGGIYTGYLGNYYSTYAGADADGNGVGDTAFTSGSYWTDSYPLKAQYANYVETALPPAPVAAFTSDVQSGDAPLNVQFTDASTGSITGYAWDFNNDGTTDSTAQSPSYQYTAAGTYTVNLTVTGPGGSDAEVKTGYISVSSLPAAPVAAFGGTPLSGDAPLTVQFTDASTGSITGYAWDFDNDGITDNTTQSPSYTYATTGTYTVNLTVTGPGGSDSQVNVGYITVNAAPVAPVAAFGSDTQSGTAPLTVHFTDASTGTPTSWAWDFTNDGTVDSTTQSPSHIYSTAGTYTVNLTVTNAGGNDSEVKTDYITVTAAGPKTWYVDDSGGSDFTTIQAAVTAANAGDTIIVRDGTYPENVVVGKSLIISSENVHGATVNPVSGNVFTVAVSHVTIEGFIIAPSTLVLASQGIHQNGGVSSCTYRNNQISNLIIGFYIDNDASGNEISGNTITIPDYNAYSYCMYIRSSNNTITDNACIDLGKRATSYGIYVKQQSEFTCSRNTISGNTITSTGYAIYLEGSTNANILANHISSNTINGFNKYAIYISKSDANIISDNTIVNNDSNNNGISIFTSTSNNNIIENNICRDELKRTTTYGIYLSKGNTQKVTGNTLDSTGQGIYLSGTNSSIIHENTFFDNNRSIGLSATSSTNQNRMNVFYLNSITGSKGADLYINGAYNTGNTWNSLVQTPYSYNGAQYTGYMGNYWGRYAVTDIDGNGIGDTPFITASPDADNYPLMGSWKNGEITYTPPAVIAPVAAFTSDVQTGPAPLTVNFTDQSINTPTSWAWDMNNDGVVDYTTKNATHTYATAGTYTVNLTVTNAGGSDSEVKTDFITVTGAGGPKTWYVDDSGGADFTTLQDAVAAASSGDTIFIWNGTYLGPANADLGINIPHLTIIGEGADVVSYSGNSGGFRVPNDGGDATGTVVKGIKFTNLMQGFPVGLYGSAQNTVIRDCIIDGLSNGAKINSQNITFENNTVANFTSSITLYVGSPPTVSADSAKIIDNRFLNNKGYVILFSKNGIVEGNTFNHTGNYALSLYGASATNNTITGNSVTSNTGAFLFQDSGNENRFFLNNVVGNTNLVSISGTAPATTYWTSSGPVDYTYNGITHSEVLGNFWDIYAGSDADNNGIGDTAFVVHASLGSDTAPLMGAWNNGEITYTPPAVIAPVATFTSDFQTGTAPLTVNFTDQSTNTPTSWAWDVNNDGTVDYTTQNATHIFTTAGNYTVNLTVTNAGGNDSEVKTDYITVTAAGPKTWYVDDSGGADFTTIQAAVNAATDGDTIIVRDGTYPENVVVGKSLTIQSENGRDATTVQAGSSVGFTITASHVTIHGFTITGTSMGIFSSGTGSVTNSTITDNNFSGFGASGAGMRILHVNSSTITGNICNNNQYGIMIEGAQCTVDNNICSNNSQYGIFLTTSGGSWAGKSRENIISSNTLSGNLLAGILIYKTQSNTITGNTFSNNQYGIQLRSSGTSTVQLATLNKIYQNNFINSTTSHIGFYDATGNTGNIWNSQSPMAYSYNSAPYNGYMGNYWSGYSGVDTDGNGIGDTPNQTRATPDEFDNYPLMGSWDNGVITYTPPAVTAPVAAFISDVQTGTAPLTVNFTDQSTNTPTSWAWDVNNDGTVDYTTQNATHIFTTAGTYTVNLTVTNAGGNDSEVKTDFITVSPPTPALLWGPYLTGTTTTGTVVNVKTNIATAVTVEYATDAYYTAHSAYDQSATDSVSTQLHHVSLAGLTPDTLYHYRVVYDGQATGDLHFSTFPASGAFTFVVYSDTQDQLPTFSQLERHKLVADRIAEEPDVAFVLNSGDLVNNAADLNDWDRYFAAGSMMMANTTVYPALGNHDDNDPNYFAAYGVPAYYSFDCGDGHVAVLDSNDWAWPDLPTQSAWLANDLQTDKPFKFTSFHYPLYTSDSKHFGGWENLREAWEDDFNDNDVLAVFNGHVHAYERFLVNDTNYFVAGIGGGPSYNLATPRYTGSQNSLEYMIGYTRVTIDPAAGTATAQVIRVADVSSDLKSLTTVYPAGTVFETVVMSLPEEPLAPVAAFTSDIQTGTAPLTVNFTDASTGTPTSWAWDVNNDGTVDYTTQNVTHTFTAAGTYTVNLTATNSAGSDSEVKAGWISVTSEPGPVVDTLFNGTVSLTPGETFTKVAYNSGTNYTINRTTPLGALDVAATTVGFTYDVTDKNYATSGLLLDNIGTYLYQKTPRKAWYAYVNDVYKDGYNNKPNALNVIELSDGDRVEFYYVNGNVADATNLAAVKANASAAVKIVADTTPGPTIDVLFNGTVMLTPGETFTKVAYNSGTSYTINRTTPLGALDVAATTVGFTYDVTDKNYATSELLLDNIGTYLYQKTPRKAWYAYVNDVYKDGYNNKPNALNVIELSDGDRVEFYFVNGTVADSTNLAAVKANASAAVKTVASTGVTPTDWSIVIDGAKTQSVTKTYFEQGLACPSSGHMVNWTDAEGNEWSGVPLWLLVAMVDDNPDSGPDHFNFNDALAAQGYSIKVTAGDGYTINFESADIARNNNYIVANTLNGQPLPLLRPNSTKPCFPLQLIGSAVTSGKLIGNLTSIELIGLPEPSEGWTLTMEGDVVDTITQKYFEEALACIHNTTWTDGSGNVWSGVLLWELAGAVDDVETTSHWTFNDTLASSGYTIRVIAGDGYNKTFVSSDVARNGGYLVANIKNSQPLSGTEAPLRLVGINATGGKSVGNISTIRLEGLPAYPSGAWSLQLDGAISDSIPQPEFEEWAACHPATYTDGPGNVYEGIPLWRFMGWVDDRIPHGSNGFNNALAQAGYKVIITAGDGYSKEFTSQQIGTTSGYIVANTMNGAPLPTDGSHPPYPLRLVGAGLPSASDSVGNIVKIQLTDFQTPVEVPKLHIVKYGSDGITVINETTIDYHFMESSLPVVGDGVTRYKYQGVTFDPADLWDPTETKGMNPPKIDNAIKGTKVKDLVELVGGMGTGTDILFVASDGYETHMGYSNIYTNPYVQSQQGDAVIAWYADGQYVPQYADGMRFMFTPDDHVFGQWNMHEAMDSKYWHYYWSDNIQYPSAAGTSAKWVTEIKIYSSPETDWQLDLDGSDIGGIKTNISKTYLEQALACQFGSEHKATYTDNKGNVWEGMPLWFFAGFVDDADQHSNNAFNESLASAGYRVVITAGDGYNTTIDSSMIIRNSNYIVANSLNGSHIAETDSNWPLRLTGANVSGGNAVKNIVSIRLLKSLQAPNAAFSADPLSGTVPLSVAFTDASTGTPTSWAWDFTNDGTVDSTEQSPSHIYNTAGTYTVNLTVTNAGGSDSEVKTDYITVTAAPVAPTAAFTSDVQTGTAPLTVTFTDQSTGDTITAWAWDFQNDGTVDSTEQNPVFIYSTAGTYTVNLTVTNAGGSDSEVKTNYLTVNAAPTPDYTLLLTGDHTVTLTKAEIESIVANGQSVSYTDTTNGRTWNGIPLWYLVGAVDDSDTGFNFNDNRAAMNYQVQVRAGDGFAKNFTSSAIAGSSNYIIANTLNGSVIPFTDPTNSNKLWWPLKGVGSGMSGGNSVGNITEIRLIGLPVPPVANFTATPLNGNAPLTVQFMDISTGTAPLTYVWDFNNDGVTDNTTQSPSYTYVNAGTYTVNLTVTNGAGSDSEIKTGYITVEDDADNDGILDSEEQGPGGADPVYDGNGDGTPDRQQENVASFHTTTDAYVTLVSLGGMHLTDVQAVDNPSPADTPVYLTMPFGFINFTITGITPGGAVTVQLYLPAGSTFDTYYKYGKTPDNAIPHWYEFLFDGTTGAEISENIITLHFVDGIRGDNDITANGIIIDPSGPGIDIRTPPTAAFSANPVSGTAPLLVQFTDASTGTAPLSYAWDFNNDGLTDNTTQSPSYTYATAGTYTVNLTVTNEAGSDFEVKTGHITVNSPLIAPTAAFSSDIQTGTAPLTVTFTDASTGTGPLTYAWDFNNDGTIDSTVKNPAYVYSIAGTYTVNLSVTGPGGSDSELKTDYITVTVKPPVPIKPEAAFSGTPTSGNAPLTVQFTDQSKNTPTSWKWEYKKGSGSWTQFSTAPSPSYTFPATGTYGIRLTATNAAGSNTQTKTSFLTVTALQKPDAAFIGAPTSGYAPLTVAFTDQSTNTPTSWKWEYKKGSGSWTQFSTAQSPSYTFTATGTYSIRLTATNAAGSNTQMKTSYITVTALEKPVAAFSATPLSGSVPLTVKFTDKSTGTAPLTYAWDFNNDGVVDSTVKDPTYTYTKTGTYIASLKVTNTAGSSTKQVTITVQPPAVKKPVAQFMQNTYIGKVPLTVQFTDKSQNNPTSYLWHFGDGSTSTAKSPSHTYTSPGVYVVRLTAINSAGSDTETSYVAVLPKRWFW